MLLDGGVVLYTIVFMSVVTFHSISYFGFSACIPRGLRPSEIPGEKLQVLLSSAPLPVLNHPSNQ